MQTVREVISEVRTDLRANSVDEWLPSKYIHSKLQSTASLFIKREADDRRLQRYQDLWVEIDCLEMEEIPLIQCCDLDIPNCKTVMRSKKKLPDTYSTRYGYALTISSVDYDRDYIPTTPREYKYIQLREYQDKTKRYYWIENGHLIIPGSMVQNVRVRGMFVNKAEALRFNVCGDDGGCINFLDQEFIAPEHLLKNIKDATVAAILGSNKQLQTDELPNLNSNEKTNPTKI